MVRHRGTLPGEQETLIADPILVGRTAWSADVLLLPQMANRHGAVAGATGTGQTVTLQALAESLSRAGVVGEALISEA